ncbi:DUF1924 domain-containing protein [uncultured Thiodictyon sp.]|jgi:hypothetical protein|uniref:DUF1924 domain-containing protein n=1 Tax=uncultured Thiodictyon sp. TaxID=1846217 RepID=UPI0025F96370|nr:DUF1924 domain-containing protein [uncultured Thiodictyon sp.]
MNSNFNRRLVFALAIGVSALADTAAAAPGDALLATYQGQGAGPFTAAAGAQGWTAKHQVEGESRSCATCHGADLTKSGKHAATGKPIEPLAVSANSKGLTDPAKVEKWLGRNCRWTLGRNCTPQEKGDFVKYIQSL